MHTFKDTEGREWQLKLNITAVKRVRDLAGVDLMDTAGGETLARLAQDPIALVDTLYAICKPQTEVMTCGKCKGWKQFKRGDDGSEVEVPCDACEQTGRFTDQQFGEAMAGEAIHNATKALLEELADFFPDPGMRRVMKAMRENLDDAEKAQGAIIDAELDNIDIEKVMRDAMKNRGKPSTAPPDTSGSTPAH